MIDIHTHILPGIDDGSKDMEESFNYLKRMRDLGVDSVVLTPHFYPGYYTTGPEKILKLTEELSNHMEKYFQDSMKFYPGTEVYLSEDTVEQIISKEVMTMNNNDRYVLFEIDFSFIAPNMEDMIKKLQRSGFLLIWAHPERNSKITDNPDILKDFIDLDVLIQMNLGSLGGEFGPRIQHAARYILRSDMVHFIGSDCHCDGKRGDFLKESFHHFETDVNPELKDTILNLNPQKMLDGKVIYPFAYKNLKRSRLKKVLNFFGIGK